MITIKNTPTSTQLVNNLKPGDMVWAKMSLSHEQLSKIKPTHRFRPYLIAKIDSDGIFAFQASSSKRLCLNNYQTYAIDQSNFGYSKNSWLNLSELYQLPFENLCYKMFHLSDYDLSMIEKRIQIQFSLGQASLFPVFNLPSNICAGDIITNINNSKTSYYVYTSDKSNLICYPLSRSFVENWAKVAINQTTYYIDFANQSIFPKSTKVSFEDIASSSEISVILHQKAAAKHKIRKGKQSIKKECEIGSIFSTSQGNIMYLYTSKGKHYGVNLTTYTIASIQNISDLELLEICSFDKLSETVNFLFNYLKYPPRQLTLLYQNLTFPQN